MRDVVLLREVRMLRAMFVAEQGCDMGMKKDESWYEAVRRFEGDSKAKVFIREG